MALPLTTITRYVEYKHAAHGIAQVRRNQAFELFLTCSVPQLETAEGALVLDVLAHEVDADGGLSDWAGTLKNSSKRLVANFSMMHVFPTPLSPRKMILWVLLPTFELLLEYDIIMLSTDAKQTDNISYAEKSLKKRD